MNSSNGNTLSLQLADFAVEVRERGLDAVLRHQAARRMLDLCGNSMLARRERTVAAVLGVVRSWGGNPVAGVLGTTDRLPAPSAALVNGTLAHAMDFDDSHARAVLHPSASVIPAALAAAETSGASGPSFLDATVVGTEVCIRLGLAGYDERRMTSIFFERGQHATSICGALGAAVAAAMLYGADRDTIAAAIAGAASMGSGILEANRVGGSVKRIHCGWAAHSGVAAADLAVAGITGPPTVLDGRFGFFRAWCDDQANLSAVTDGLGSTWESNAVIAKPYPCNHFTHPGIDAALRLRDRGLVADEIESAELGVPAAVLRTIGEPADVKAAPPTGYAAAFSGPYTIAAALVGGGGLGLWLDDFTDEAASDPVRLVLAGKVRCVPSPWAQGLLPERFGTELTVRTRDGRTWRERVDDARGMTKPLSDEELNHKFVLAAERVLPRASVGMLRDAIFALSRGGQVTEVLRVAANTV